MCCEAPETPETMMTLFLTPVLITILNYWLSDTMTASVTSGILRMVISQSEDWRHLIMTNQRPETKCHPSSSDHHNISTNNS